LSNCALFVEIHFYRGQVININPEKTMIYIYYLSEKTSYGMCPHLHLLPAPPTRPHQFSDFAGKKINQLLLQLLRKRSEIMKTLEDPSKRMELALEDDSHVYADVELLSRPAAPEEKRRGWMARSKPTRRKGRKVRKDGRCGLGTNTNSSNCSLGAPRKLIFCDTPSTATSTPTVSKGKTAKDTEKVCDGAAIKRAIAIKVAAKNQDISAAWTTWSDMQVELEPRRITWASTSVDAHKSVEEIAIDADATVSRYHAIPHAFIVRSNPKKRLVVAVATELKCTAWVIAVRDSIKKCQWPDSPFQNPSLDFDSNYTIASWQRSSIHGDVYNGERSADGKVFGVKMLRRATLQCDGVDVKVVEREVCALSQIRHPYIVNMETFFKQDDAVLLVMDRCNGGNLFTRVQQDGRYPQERTRVVVEKILGALAFCHEHNVVHGKVTAENIWLESEVDHTSVKLTEFGLGKTKTVGYLAPEVVNKGAVGYHDRVCPEKVDVWAVGILAIFLLTGKNPYSAQRHRVPSLSNPNHLQVAAIATGHMQGGCCFAGAAWNGIHEDAKGFIQDALNPDAVARPSASELLQHRWLSSVLESSIDFGDGFPSRATPTTAKAIAPMAILRSLLDSGIACECGPSRAFGGDGL
jgi:hypothetical protein